MRTAIGMVALAVCIGFGGHGEAQSRPVVSPKTVSAQTIAALPPGAAIRLDLTGGKSVKIDLSKGPIDYDRIIIIDGAAETTLGDHLDEIQARHPDLANVSGGSFTIRGMTMSGAMSPDMPNNGGGGKGKICCFCVCDGDTGACECTCSPCYDA
jgi:hypothetical protein